jgi:hypothetical protein
MENQARIFREYAIDPGLLSISSNQAEKGVI